MNNIKDETKSNSINDPKLIADAFWVKLSYYFDKINSNILSDDYDKYQQNTHIIERVKIDLGVTDNIGIYFTLGTRNNKTLNERSKQIEMIISPLFKISNLSLMSAIYDIHHKYAPKNWNVVKYKFWQPSFLYTITINYDNKENTKGNIKDDIEITKDNFEYCPYIDNMHGKVSIILFVDDNVSQYIIKKETVKIKGIDRELWIPSDSGIYSMIDCAIGEFNLLNTVENMEIYLKSEHSEIHRYPLEHLTQTIIMINNNPLSNINKCSRCEYNNTQRNLSVCQCGCVYYCDKICQKAHRPIHKSICKKR